MSVRQKKKARRAILLAEAPLLWPLCWAPACVTVESDTVQQCGTLGKGAQNVAINCIFATVVAYYIAMVCYDSRAKEAHKTCSTAYGLEGKVGHVHGNVSGEKVSNFWSGIVRKIFCRHRLRIGVVAAGT